MMPSSTHDLPLAAKAAIVTGAGRGIGRSIALALAAQGASVTLAARTLAELESVRSEIEARNGAALSIPTDLRREADIVRLVQATVERFGRLDILVNNAAVGVFGPLAETTTSQWDDIMAINARAPFLLCRESLPYLRQNPPGFIVNIGSVVSVKGYVNQAAYSASKHALLGMSKVLAKEVQADGIRVHAVLPGGVDTAMAAQARPDLDRSILIQPEEVADIVLFLVTRRGNAVIDQIDVHRATATPWA
jgi:3-oxoacyl-[acyl-carrier protein] reductase